MKKRFAYISTIVTSAAIWIAQLNVALADDQSDAALSAIFGGGSIIEFGIGIANSFANVIMYAVSWLLIATGVLLNASLTLTLNISSFVNNITGIYEVWQAIRDLSALLLIFFLLWAAIQMILSLQSPKMADLIKNLIIAGVLINFSFFFVSVLIDASNVLSLQIYKQMVPKVVYDNSKIPPVDTASGQKITARVAKQSYEAGGISNVFMTAFNINALHDQIGQFEKKDGANVKLNIFIMQLTGIGAMLVTCFLFIFASLAFQFRLAILIFILAFSPVYFASFVIPQFKVWADKGWNLFRSQLLFMPIFLLLMYMSLKIIATGDFTGTALSPDGENFYVTMVGLFANFFFVIVMLIIPFWGATQIGDLSTKWSKEWSQGMRKWAQKKTWGGTKWAAQSAWVNTGSRAASAIGRSEGLKNWASKNWVGGAVLSGTRKASSTYDAKLAAQVKSRTDFSESLGVDKRAVQEKQAIVTELRRRQSELRSKGNSPAAKAMDRVIERAEQDLENAKNSRQQNYADRINVGTPETLWTKVARKDKVAASKIELGIIKKKYEREKKDLEKLQEGIKNKQNKIDTLRDQIKRGEAKDPVKTQNEIDKLKAENARDYAKETLKIPIVDQLEEHVRSLENIS